MPTIRQMKYLIVPLLIAAFAIPVLTSETGAVEIAFPDVTVDAGKAFDIPIMIDKIDNLAGVKLSLTYDQTILKFLKAVKTPATNSLLHIVNSKTPGKLIIVMAGARGIKGETVSIIILTFEAIKVPAEKGTTTLTMKESQLMTDALEDVSHQVKGGNITILPAEAAKSPETPETEIQPTPSPGPPS